MKTRQAADLPTHRLCRRPSALRPETWRDGDAWSALPPLTPLVMAGDGRPAQQGTLVRSCHDDEALWFRFDCEDREPAATLTDRDAPLWTEDVVEVFLAPGASTPDVYYEFEVNPLGALFDARVSSPLGCRDGMTVDAEWNCDGIAWGARQDLSGGWAAWLKIPRVPLGEPPRATIWRANFFRIDDARGSRPEYCAWSPTGATPPDFHRPFFFGTLILRDP